MYDDDDNDDDDDDDEIQWFQNDFFKRIKSSQLITFLWVSTRIRGTTLLYVADLDLDVNEKPSLATAIEDVEACGSPPDWRSKKLTTRWAPTRP